MARNEPRARAIISGVVRNIETFETVNKDTGEKRTHRRVNILTEPAGGFLSLVLWEGTNAVVSEGDSVSWVCEIDAYLSGAGNGRTFANLSVAYVSDASAIASLDDAVSNLGDLVDA